MHRLYLGIALIALTASILLFSDREQRRGGAQKIPRVAVLQYASTVALDDSVEGSLAALREAGFEDGRNIVIRRFNSEADSATMHAMAREIVSGQFDYALTVATPPLQAVANANKQGKLVHVFAAVADPGNTGVGASVAEPLKHPRHLIGIGTLMPLEEDLRLARQCFPGLRKVGLVYNPAEANSAVYTRKAAAECQRLGIELITANADNSAAVPDAANAVVARGAQAILLSGDNTVTLAAKVVIEAARKAHIPAFSVAPQHAEHNGALFSLGADFFDVGHDAGALLVQAIKGADTARIPIENRVPLTLVVNKQALAGLRDPWQFPAGMLAKADVLVDEKGAVERRKAARKSGSSEKVYKAGLVLFAPEEGADIVVNGILEGLREEGIVEGKNLELKRSHAQGEISNIPALFQNYDSQGLDVILALTTPCLTAACNTVRKTPVVFSYVYDPLAAGAGPTRTDHVAHVTGVGSFPPVEDTVEVIRKLVPGVRVVGTLYNSSEANSRKVIAVGREAFKKRGIRLEEVTITGTSEVFQAAQVVATKGIQALWVTGDNTALQAFASIAKAAEQAKLPLVINDPEFVEKGALLAVGLGWKDPGKAAGKLAARVMRGQSPRYLPIQEVAVKKLVLNQKVAQRLGVTFSKELVDEAAR